MNKYEMIIYWSDEDKTFIVEVPKLAGCAALGDTYELALENAKQAVQLWIDTAGEFGDPIPQPEGRRLMPACRTIAIRELFDAERSSPTD